MLLNRFISVKYFTKSLETNEIIYVGHYSLPKRIQNWDTSG